MKNIIQKQKSICALLVGLIVLSGCNWPRYGSGGMDETFSYSRYSSVTNTQTIAVTRIKKIAVELDFFRDEIDHAWQGSAGKHRPAKLTLIDMQWNRATREFAGGLYADAEINLQLLHQMWREMRQELSPQLINKSI